MTLTYHTELTRYSQVIYLNDWEWRYRPRNSTSERRERVYLTECHCGRGRYLTLRDARRATQCHHCQRVAAGNACVAKHGREAMLEHVQRWREANPNKPEQAMERLLTDIGIEYRREVILKAANGNCYLMDFHIPIGDNVVVIELNGHYWHDRPRQQERDTAKATEIARRGWRLVVLDSEKVFDMNASDVLAIVNNNPHADEDAGTLV